MINEVKKSGLRGRGGGGFPTGLKWELTRKNDSDQKYIICNADEGDPGAFMDRSIIEGNPHLVLEGMIIAGYAIGATKGVVYVRAEYQIAVERLTIAIEKAREYGILGKNILGSTHEFDIDIRIGAGAFVCGEETALIASVEGKRGEPVQKPPFPAKEGLKGKPTVINNVETFANIQYIILKGGDNYAKTGTEKSKGTKVFALAGDIKNTGLIEVPMGISLGDIIFGIGHGVPNGKKFKVAQTGGPSGGCLTPAHLNVAVDYDSLKEHGAIMGSGGMVIMDEDTCMVDVARYFMEFVQEESCGKCVPCRVGTKRMLEILERITRGEGRQGDIELLIELGESIKDSALCGLGQTASNPVLSTIKYFRHEYEEHINDKYCRAGICQALFISPCENACPANVNIPGYLSLISAGRIEDAYRLIRQENPFPSVCGRVCTHPCEAKCRRAQLDDPLSIMELKRFVADSVMNSSETFHEFVLPRKNKTIGIVGAGPSGLTCGYYLARLGYDVTVYEEQNVAGGVLAFGIPQYRLPKEVLKKEIDTILNVGVKIEFNKKIGSDISLDEIKAKYDSVYISTGTQLSKNIGIEGESLKGIYKGLNFLKDVNLSRDIKINGVVAVIGGGNTAIDAARTALRRGADEVNIYYRREIDDMPADRYEIDDAIDEGVKVHPLCAPVRFIGEGDKIKSIELVKMKLGEYDTAARKKPKVIKGSEYLVNADMVILAVSQETDLSFIKKEEIELTDWNTFIVDKKTQMNFSAGNFCWRRCACGSDIVITAIADGKRAAKSIDKFLGGSGKLHITHPIEIPVPKEESEVIEHERFNAKFLAPEKRRNNFQEVSLGYHKKRNCGINEMFEV